ncbi:MAG: CRISPR-associated endonuclease Cas1 [Mycoplasmatales bacterium]
MESNTYYFISPEIEVDNKTLFVNEEYYPIKNTESIYLMGQYDINTQLISLLNKEDVLLHYGNYYGNYLGSYYPYNKRFNNKLVLKQYEKYVENKKNQKFEKLISKEYVKLIRSLLKYYNSRKYIELNVDKLEQVCNLKDINKFFDEALIKKFYFQYYFEMVNKYGWNISEREYHQEQLNPINSLLSFYYSLIYKDTISSLYKQGLDPRISYIHAVNNRRNTSLEFDISDHYKVLLVDRLILKLVKSQKLTLEMFNEKGYIKTKYLKLLIQEYEKFMEKKYTYNVGKLTGKQLIDKQINIYKKYLLESEKFIGIKLI